MSQSGSNCFPRPPMTICSNMAHGRRRGPLWIRWAVATNNERKVTDHPWTLVYNSLAMIRSQKVWPRIVAHADMDAFYVAIEQLDEPALRGKPVLIGPPSARGVVLTA